MVASTSTLSLHSRIPTQAPLNDAVAVGVRLVTAVDWNAVPHDSMQALDRACNNGTIAGPVTDFVAHMMWRESIDRRRPANSRVAHIPELPLPAINQFEAKKEFVENKEASAKLRIFSMNKFFVDSLIVSDKGLGHCESGVPQMKYRFCQVQEHGRFSEIVEELGGVERVKAKLAHFHSVLLTQGQGQSGFLHTDGTFNRCLVEHEHYNLGVSARWMDGKGWELIAMLILDPNCCMDVGDQFFYPRPNGAQA